MEFGERNLTSYLGWLDMHWGWRIFMGIGGWYGFEREWVGIWIGGVWRIFGSKFRDLQVYIGSWLIGERGREKLGIFGENGYLDWVWWRGYWFYALIVCKFNDFILHGPKILTFQFTPVTHMVYLEIRLHYLDFAC